MASERGLELADIIAKHGSEALERYPFSAEQRFVMNCIRTCRTAERGGHLYVCSKCGDEKPAYNSCRDRHCPKCLATSQARWIALRLGRILPVGHFHIVFTIPGRLRPLVQDNPKVCLNLLFSAASETLKAFAQDEKWLGAQLGITAVLHTWTRELLYHPHLHCVVTAGGLTRDGTQWKEPTNGDRLLFPVNALAKVFRAKFLEGLRKRYANDKLKLLARTARLERPEAFQRLIDKSYKQKWVVYAKRPFLGKKHVFSYLGRYTHRVAISNQRLVKLDDDGVHFVTKNNRVVAIDPVELIRRFCSHVLPKRFVKIRHYGLYASANVNTRLERARDLLPPDSEPPPLTPDELRELDVIELLTHITGKDPSTCKACGVGTMRPTESIAPSCISDNAAVSNRGPPQP